MQTTARAPIPLRQRWRHGREFRVRLSPPRHPRSESESDGNISTTDLYFSPAVGSISAEKTTTETADDNCHPHSNHDDSGGDSPNATAEPEDAEMVDKY